MHRAGALFFGKPDGLTNPRRDDVTANNLTGILGKGPHHVDDVHDLELALLASFDRLLSRNHHHGHGAELRVSGSGDEIGCARSEGGQADAGFSGKAPVGRGHESGSLFVASEDELDLRLPQGFEQIEIFLAGNSEDVLHALFFETAHK